MDPVLRANQGLLRYRVTWYQGLELHKSVRIGILHNRDAGTDGNDRQVSLGEYLELYPAAAVSGIGIPAELHST